LHDERVLQKRSEDREKKAMNSQTAPTIPLGRAITDLRAELLEALREGAGKELRFRLKPIELELSVGITGSADAKAGVKFWVLELGGGAKLENATTHKLKLILEPVGPGGREFDVTDDMAPRPAERGAKREPR
jgi:hypothetical protein